MSLALIHPIHASPTGKCDKLFSRRIAAFLGGLADAGAAACLILLSGSERFLHRLEAGNLHGLHVGGKTLLIVLPPLPPPSAIVLFVVSHTRHFTQAEIPDAINGVVRVVGFD